MDPQTDLWGNTIHQDISGNSYIHDGYGQRQYLDQPSHESSSSNSGSSGGGWSGDSGGGGGGGDSSGGGSSGGDGGGGSSAGGASCLGILVLGMLGMCFCGGLGNWLKPHRPTVHLPIKKPLPISAPRKDASTETAANTPITKPSPSTGSKPSDGAPKEVPASKPVASHQTWHGKLQLVERHQRTGAVKNSSKWTDIRLALQQTGDEVTGEVHFLEVGVTASVIGRIAGPSLTLIIDRVTSGPAAAVIVPCVLSGQPDAKQVYRGHWNAGVNSKPASTHPRFWLSAGEPQ